MSKVPLRARALDAAKAMPIYSQNDIPDLADYAACNRTISALPTGVDKEEEMELHLQQALSAQQASSTGASGSGENFIPVPEVSECPEVVAALAKPDYEPTRTLIKVQASLSLEPQIPDYDLDEADSEFLVSLRSSDIELKELELETMMDRLEKNTEQSVTTMEEAKAILAEFHDEAIAAVYDYWLAKRCETKQPLIPRVKTERAGDRASAALSPYLAFRRRAERMQTRKNRKNDEDSYEKILRLSHDLRKALTLLEMVKRREKSKRELLSMEMEILERRWTSEDWESLAYQEILRETRPAHSFGLTAVSAAGAGAGSTTDPNRPKPPRPKKTKRAKAESDRGLVSREWLQQNLDDWNRPFSVPGTPASAGASRKSRKPPPEPDGPYTFRRLLGCVYYPANNVGAMKRASPASRLQPHPIPLALPRQEKRRRADHAYESSSSKDDSLHHLFLRSFSGGLKHIGQARARRGRGGRLIFDRCLDEGGGRSGAWKSPDPLSSQSQASSGPVSPASSASISASTSFPSPTGQLPTLFAPLRPSPEEDSSARPKRVPVAPAPVLWDRSSCQPPVPDWNTVVSQQAADSELPEDWYGDDDEASLPSILVQTPQGHTRMRVSIGVKPTQLSEQAVEIERQKGEAEKRSSKDSATNANAEEDSSERGIQRESAWMAAGAVLELAQAMKLVEDRAPLEAGRCGAGAEEEDFPLPTPSPSPTHSQGPPEAGEKTGVAALSAPVAAEASPALAISPPDSLAASSTLPPSSGLLPPSTTSSALPPSGLTSTSSLTSSSTLPPSSSTNSEPFHPAWVKSKEMPKPIVR